MNSDKLLGETFNSIEIKSFESIINYMDRMVVDRTKTTDVNKAYHLFFDEISSAIKDSSKLIVPFEEKEKFDFLEKIDTTVFNAIWQKDKHPRTVKYQDTISTNLNKFKNLQFNSTGRYMEYLKKLGQTDEDFYKIHYAISVAGDLPPGTAIWFPLNNSKFDFNIVKNRLWAAIYILTMEKHIETKLK